MRFDEYQRGAMRTRLDTADFTYAVLNLAGEAGEITSKVAKAKRDKTTLNREDIALECGDVMWSLALIAEELGISMASMAQMNLDKLASRKARGTLGGSGDHR
jgi:NTP pyrophosphatase (non-canonical NTP hydrolase)